MFDATKEEREKYLNQMFNLPTYKILKSEYKEHRAVIPAVEESLQIELNRYATITGKRLFINPNIFGFTGERPLADTTRKYDYIIDDSYRDIDSVEIKIPDGYKPESVPKDNSFETKFGRYISSLKIQDSKIIYYRMMEQNSGRIPPSEYNDLVKFYDQVNKADRGKLVLVKAE
jgi:hypothetical protein